MQHDASKAVIATGMDFNNIVVQFFVLVQSTTSITLYFMEKKEKREVLNTRV
jgi:hypothetical protein